MYLNYLKNQRMTKLRKQINVRTSAKLSGPNSSYFRCIAAWTARLIIISEL